MIPFPAWVALTSVRYRETHRRDTISWYQCSRFGIWIRYLDISYLKISHDMGYNITIYRDIPCDITPDRPETTGKQTRNFVAVYCLFSISVSAPWLACRLSVPRFLSSFCCPSAGRIIGLTAPPANKNNLVPSGLGLLPERTNVFFYLFVFSPSYFFPFFCLQ